ncbi:MAG TPA: hypothetical protein VKH81_04905 [Candidatus Angelobacter sp.]|nr:hypothetical protein [Candidatus Angelobacter sp.]
MKNALVRLLTLAALATSLSAFAATGNYKSDEPAASAHKQQSGCADTSQETKKQKKNKNKQQNESQEEKDFDRLLLGTHG